MENTMDKISYNVPLVREVDVLVIGGGCAGIAAAVSASRHGSHVLLVDKNSCLGGMATAGLVGPFMTSFDPMGKRQVIRGAFQEMVDRMINLNGAIHPKEIQPGTSYTAYRVFGHAHCTPFSSEAFKIAAEEMCIENGVELLYDTFFVSTVKNNTNGNIESVVFATKAGLIRIKSKLVIDATGDGDVAYESGVPFVYGDEKGNTQPASMFFTVQGVDKQKLERVREQTGDFRSMFYRDVVLHEIEEGRYTVPREKIALYENPDGTFRVNMSRVYLNDRCDPFEFTCGTIRARKQIAEITDMLKRCIPGCENITLVESAQTLGVRESRRIQGDFVLTGDDIKNKIKFSDVIFLSGNSIDMHSSTGSMVNYQPMEGEAFQVPYRILLPRKITNLLVAGRCCSLDREALASLRVMPPVFAMGQAAGTAAAICVAENLTPANVPVDTLQQMLRHDGAVLE